MKLLRSRRLRRFVIVLTIPIILIGCFNLWARGVSDEYDHKYFATLHTLNEPDIGNEIVELRWSPDSLTMGEYTGKYVNVHNGERLTIGDAFQATHDLYLLGSSVVFDPYEDDAHTMASQLQALLPNYRVHNLGVIGTNATISLARLKTVRLHVDDVVIFDTGIIEVEDIEKSVVGRYKPENCNDENSYFYFWFYAQRLVCRWLATRAIEPLKIPASYQSEIDSELAHYGRALDGAKAYTDTAHATFINVLQPYLFTEPLSDREQMLATWDPTSPGLPPLYSQVYVRLRTLRPAVTVDLSSLFDATRRKGGVELYADSTHYNHQGDHVIAEAIAAWVTAHIHDSQQLMTM